MGKKKLPADAARVTVAAEEPRGKASAARTGGGELRLRLPQGRRMGCINSKEDAKEFKPRWKSEEPVTVSGLQKLRDEFWDTAPAYGGSSVIWDALKVAVSTEDISQAK